MNVMTAEEPRIAYEDPIVAEHIVFNWQRIASKVMWLTEEMAAGRLAPCAEIEHRGIVGPQIDGLWRVDIELVLAPTNDDN